EIKEFKNHLPDLEIEMFVHGAMCMAYSGRCLISAYLNNRNANKGECTQPCRWNYKLVEQKRPNEQFDVEEDEYGTYFFNSRDLNLSQRMKEIFDAGVDSIKIEGRMKSVIYVANVTRIYRRFIDVIEGEKDFNNNMLNELDTVSHRLYTNGFFDGENSYEMQNYDSSSYIRDYQFIGEIIDSTDSYFIIKNHAKFSVGEKISIIFPDIDEDFIIDVKEILDEFDKQVEFTKPNTEVKIPYPKRLPEFGIVRKKI
ncbi:MAG: U32 family peptidase C-terminal domain-containing protein, partial [Candidatus Cloacimonadota bacterium]|nr:U32 family peptidase C-terminal domain-containing protein [Candidatus Cloacimonadota bacterium]